MAKGSGSTKYQGASSASASKTTSAPSQASSQGVYVRKSLTEQTPIGYLQNITSELKSFAGAESAHVERNPGEALRKNGERDIISISMPDEKAYGDSYNSTLIIRANSAEQMIRQHGKSTHGSVPSSEQKLVSRIQEWMKKKNYDGIVNVSRYYD